MREATAQVCDAADTPHGTERDRPVDDVTALADIFTGVMDAKWLRLRFDAVTARLVCTYRGTGTQYAISTNGAEPQHICTVPTGAPILLRGTLWPQQPRSGPLHRSPPIEGTGETRLVLVLDPATDPEDEV